MGDVYSCGDITRLLIKQTTNSGISSDNRDMSVQQSIAETKKWGFEDPKSGTAEIFRKGFFGTSHLIYLGPSR